MGSLQKHLRHDFVIIALAGLERLQPAARAQTPLAAAREAGDAQVVALRGGVVEELLGDLGGDGVVAEVAGGDFAVAGAGEAGRG